MLVLGCLAALALTLLSASQAFGQLPQAPATPELSSGPAPAPPVEEPAAPVVVV